MIADDVLLLAYWNYFDMLFGCAFGLFWRIVWISFGHYLVSDDIVHTYNVHKYIKLAPQARAAKYSTALPTNTHSSNANSITTLK